MSRPWVSPGMHPLAILLVALSLSIGWGVRGNWGHEFGAMIPGALAAMAAVIVSARDDWWQRIAYFAFFGALGWSFGGSISYMIVIGFTHSGDFAYGSVPYGFACLFLIGFIWAAIGGAGTALPAAVDRDRLTRFFPAIASVLAIWFVQGWLMSVAEQDSAVLAERFGVPFSNFIKWFNEEARNWHDTDWLAALSAPLAALVLELVRRPGARSAITVVVSALLAAAVTWLSSKWLGPTGSVVLGVGIALVVALWRTPLSEGSLLVAYMAGGWWLGFLILTGLFGLSMTPPRSENWSGALGMTVGMFAFLVHRQLPVVTWSGLVVGFFGGLGFSGATLLKLAGIRGAVAMINHETALREADPERTEFWLSFWQKVEQTNWHSVLEQSFGFISGIGIALVLGYLATRTERESEDSPKRHWSQTFCLLFVLLVITYLNISKDVEAWLRGNVVPEAMYGLTTKTWFNLAYLLLAGLICWTIWFHSHRRPVPLIPSSALGRAQLLFVLFLWWIVIGNLMRTTPFQEQRLITEGVIHFNTVLATLLALLLPHPAVQAAFSAARDYGKLATRTVAMVLIGFAVVVVAESWLVRAMWGEEFVGHAGLHIRFGPAATHLDPEEVRRQQILRWGNDPAEQETTPEADAEKAE